MDMFGRLLDRIASLEAEVVRLQRRVNNTFREARVEELYPSEGLARVSAHGASSKKVPWLQRAGDIRDWDPPTVGERVMLISPTGEPGKGLILPGGYSSQFQQPHDKGGEAKRVVGDTSDLWTSDTRVIESPRIILRGKVTIEGPCVTHNGIDIGSSHRHQDVMPGPALTGLSIPKDC
ncbi:MAG: phage baseplate assembly protein V [Devosia sp.]|uniref:phage baseplate assembly protein V n=1 Tax=Devosia sp. TaxID=1871048 RepID=UPI001ACB305A|nr:phage baseplate assembly protein V [Devosia sp.]MBN9308724.1 phage baseplate assembly protein V [Devosia sp.]MBN9314242.1 phage baseplate assembly protein V [Devosia sp.]